MKVRCSVALGVKKRVLMRYFMKARKLGSNERAHHLRARGGSTVLVVKPLGRSLGESRLLLTRVVASGGDLALGTNRRREPSSRRYSGYVESTRASWRPLRDAGDRHLDNLSRQERKERQAHCSVAPCVRGGSTVSLVEPLGRSRGGCLLLLTWFLSEPCLPDTCDRQACGSTEPPQALAPGTNERREPSSDATEHAVHGARTSSRSRGAQDGD